MVVAPGVVHSKLYLLEGAAGKRAIHGSLNLSKRALAGKQGKMLGVYDNHPFMWQYIERKYDAIAAVSGTAPVKLRTEVKRKDLVKMEDLPINAKLKKGQPHVDIFLPTPATETWPGCSFRHLCRLPAGNYRKKKQSHQLQAGGLDLRPLQLR